MKLNRHQARELAVQGIYQWQMTGASTDDIVAHFREEEKILASLDAKYFEACLAGVIQSIEDIDKCLAEHVDRKLSELNPVELAVLRLGTYELMFCLEVPYKVIINEALELAKTFGSTEGHKYVDGVLDNLARDVRRQEM